MLGPGFYTLICILKLFLMKKKHVRKWYIVLPGLVPVYNKRLLRAWTYCQYIQFNQFKALQNRKKFKPWPKSYQEDNVSVFICELVQPLTFALIHNSHRILLDYQCSKVTCQGFTKYHEIIFLELFDLWSWGRVTINSNSLSLILMF